MGQHDAVRDLAFGSFAGMAAKVFEHPFDLVKVRLQSQPTDRPLTFTGPLDCFRQTYVKEGWRGLYRGISAPLIGAACENAALFYVYNKCQNLVITLRPESADGLSDKARGKQRDLTTPELALAAAGAGAATSFILTPIELIKCRMQVQMLSREGAFGTVPSTAAASRLVKNLDAIPPRGSGATAATRLFSSTASGLSPLQTPPPGLPPLRGPFALIADTIRTHGVRGLWLGQVGTLFRETGGSAAWFTAYEVGTKGWMARRQKRANAEGTGHIVTKADLTPWELMASGAVAGMSYNIVLFPADSVKSAMQTSAELHPNLPAPSFWPTAARIWKMRGLRGMYAGCGLTVARAAPSSAMIFGIFETLKQRCGWIFD